jgi:hypothetical protein
MKGDLGIMSKEQLAKLEDANEIIGSMQDVCYGLSFINNNVTGGDTTYENMCKGVFSLFSITLKDAYFTLDEHIQEMRERE